MSSVKTNKLINIENDYEKIRDINRFYIGAAIDKAIREYREGIQTDLSHLEVTIPRFVIKGRL